MNRTIATAVSMFVRFSEKCIVEYSRAYFVSYTTPKKKKSNVNTVAGRGLIANDQTMPRKFNTIYGENLFI